MWHDPALVVGEIAWRWTFGLIVLLVLAFGFMVYLSTIEVSAPALWLISTREPAAIAAAFLYMFRDSGWAATRISLIALPPLGILWIMIASIGRAATLRPIFAAGTPESAQRGRSGWRQLLGLNFLRFSLWVAASIGCAAWLVIAFTAVDDPALSLLIFLAVTSVVFVIWAGLNWMLSIALIFSVRDGADTFESISLAVDLFSRRFSQLFVTSSGWGAARGIAFIAGVFLLRGVLSFSGRVPSGFLVIAGLAVALAYLAFADLLYIGRLASYVTIVEGEDEPPSETPVPVPEYPSDPGWSQLPPEQPA